MLSKNRTIDWQKKEQARAKMRYPGKKIAEDIQIPARRSGRCLEQSYSSVRDVDG